MIEIDGSQGEGGGQVLRTSLSLAMCTGQPVRIFNIRAGRAKPGLMRAHLTAVQAAAAVSGAGLEGAHAGATEIRFTPGALRGGDYHFAIGTAGSTTLVLQTVLPALLMAQAPSRLLLEGGTHNPMAPPFDFLAETFFPLLRRMGAKVEAALERHGFYPAGGGRLRVTIEPGSLRPLHLDERGALVERRAVALVAGLPERVGRRELESAREALGLAAGELELRTLPQAQGPGNVLLLRLRGSEVTELFTGFGEKGVPAERVAGLVAAQARGWLEAGVAVGPHLADQLQIPLALAGGGSFTTLEPSRHARTNLEVIRRFLDLPAAFAPIAGGGWRFSCG